MAAQPRTTAASTVKAPVARAETSPLHAKSDPTAAAGALLKFESDLRNVRSLRNFQYFAANETRLVTRSQQTFVLGRAGSRLRLEAVSTMPAVDRSAPLVVWIEAFVEALRREHDLRQHLEIGAQDVEIAKDAAFPSYPLSFLLWLPFLDLKGQVTGGLLQARLTPWTEADVVVSRHVSGACGYANTLLRTRGRSWRRPHITKWTGAFGVLALLALCFVPVSMSALAPVEVSPKSAFVVTAPTDGVVERVLVDPNATVRKGQPLVQMADTVLKNRLEVAQREAIVAEAKVKKASQLAFIDARGRHELGVAQAELQLRIAERDYARDLLARATIKAHRDGVAFFTEPKDLIGKPVAVGERLMDLADPNQLEFRIDLPVADAIVLTENARVKVFLDSDPLHPMEAKLIRADFQARPRENQQLAFRLIADRASATSLPRLGVRGTAQVYSDKVPLGFYLLRRPLSAARQWFGL